jgi:hypothetical protein
VTYDGPGAAPSREAGAGAVEARDGPGAAPSREAGARAVETRGGLGAAPSQEPEAQGHVRPWSCPEQGGGSRCLDLKLIREYPVLRVPTGSNIWDH